MFPWDETGSNKARKNSFVVIAGKEENEGMLQIAKIFLLHILKELVNRTENNYAFLQYP